MKVLIVSQPASDGVLRHVDLLCRYLIRRGVHVLLAYSDLRACDQLHDLVRHVRESDGATLNLRTGNAPQWADVSAGRRLAALIRKERPDVIHAHSSKAGGLVRALGLLGLRRPIFYTPHAYFRMHDRQNWKARVFHQAERWLGRVGTSIAMGKYEENFARTVLRVPPEQCIIIPNGIDTELFCPVDLEKKRSLRRELGLPLDAPILGTVGRFSAQKNPEFVYAALAQVLVRTSEVFFVHLGKGELEPKIDAFLAGKPFRSRIKRISYLADSRRFYQMLDGFVLASRYEGMSFAALEAFSCDLPAILTNAPGNTDLADYGFSQVWRVEPEDVNGLTEAMLAWLASFRLGDRPNHRQVMLRFFADEICNSRVLEAYQRAIAVGIARSSLPKPLNYTEGPVRDDVGTNAS
jgi:glycosyltransferase involved in cell wall biosynthesis